MKKAIKPDFFANFPSLKKEQEAKKKGATEEEVALYSMSTHSGWGVFVGETQRLLSELDKLNDVAIEKGTTFEDLGRNAIVISLCKGIVRRLLNKVDDAKEACERGTGKTG